MWPAAQSRIGSIRQQCGRVVSGCSGLDLVATTLVPSQSGVQSWRRQLVVQSVLLLL